MRKLIVIGACLALLGVFATMRTHPATVHAEDGSVATVSALQTRVVKLETRVASRDKKIGQLETRVANSSSGESPPSPTAAAASSDSAASTFLGGNAVGLLPVGEKGKIDVVLVGTYDGTNLPIVVRNNTADDLTSVSVSATVHSADGKLIAAGGDQGFAPFLVRAGSYTLGYIYFDGADLPADASFDFKVKSDKSGTGKFSKLDLEISEANFLGDRVVGILLNGHDGKVTGSMGVKVVCLDSAGAILGEYSGYTDAKEAAPGEAVPFQVSFYGGVDCTNFVVAANGYNF